MEDLLANIRDSGLLELYVLGYLDESDQQKIKLACKAYPALSQELAEIEMGLERYALQFERRAPRTALHRCLLQIACSFSKN